VTLEECAAVYKNNPRTIQELQQEILAAVHKLEVFQCSRKYLKFKRIKELCNVEYGITRRGISGFNQ
jgi:hypothetical protein